MPVFTYRTTRTVEVVADSEQEADRLVQNELSGDETVQCLISEEEETPR